jgi:penicillin-binding protein 2
MRNSYEQRKFLIIGIILAVGLIFAIRLFKLQVYDSKYKLSAENNVLRYVTQYPPRGLIYDRNGDLLVYNEAAYDLLVVPGQLDEFDTAALCRLLDIEKDDFLERLSKAKAYSWYKPSVFIEQISKEDYGYLEEMLFRYPGFYVQARTLRKYPNPIAAHVLGYVGEVSQKEIDRKPYYKPGDYIGKSGVEKAYEDILRGRNGMKIIMVDVFNREKGSFENGRYDTNAVAGKDLVLSLDIELQEYGERLLKNKKGSIVALDPASGEILALVSSPNYDPNLLVGRIRSENFLKLSRDTLEPLFNRATMAQYPPGSTFKLLNALIGMHDNVLSESTEYDCNGLATYPIPCSHNHESPLDLVHAIEQSCNPYFWQVYKSILEEPGFRNIQQGYDHWKELVMQFGVGTLLETDLLEQSDGNLPAHSYFDKYYGKKGWKAITVRSLSIGQGEIELTPLQLANFSSTIANKGFYYPPHLLKEVKGEEDIVENLKEKKTISINTGSFETIIEGMSLVYEGEHGSARWYKNDSIPMCGKTGTAQNPHGENHSVFIAFAPKEDPKIAIAVVVENSGYGSTWAAPIATLMMEKYLTGEVKPTWFEEKILNSDLISGN